MRYRARSGSGCLRSMMSCHSGTEVTGRPSASRWKNSGCSETSTLSGEVWLKTTSMMTFRPASCAAATSVVEVLVGAEVGMEDAVVADGVRAARGALAALDADRVDRHQEQHSAPSSTIRSRSAVMSGNVPVGP